MSKKSSGIAFTIMPAENKEESDGSSGDADKEDSNVQSNLT